MHDIVVHEYNFVDPKHHNVHYTSNIKGMWVYAKRKLYRLSRTVLHIRSSFSHTFNEFMWLKQMITCIRQFYQENKCHIYICLIYF